MGLLSGQRVESRHSAAASSEAGQPFQGTFADGITRPSGLDAASPHGLRQVGHGWHAVTQPRYLPAWREAWESAREQAHPDCVGFDTVLQAALQPAEGFVLLIDGPLEAPRTLFALRIERVSKRFKLGERLLGTLRITQAWLIGGHAAGPINASRLSRGLAAARRCHRFDLLALPEIPVDSGTYRALRSLGAGFAVSSPSRVDQIHWTIDLPTGFDDYLESLSSKTRQSVRYTLRKIAKELDTHIQACHAPDQVEAFLRAGEAISRQTYQWQVGQRLEYDKPTLERYLERARSGTLRAYLMHVDGQPVAFVRGFIEGDRFHYETPGYLAAYSKWSIGTALLMHTIRELIEQGDCRVFDFGGGGDQQGYKSRFGNCSTTVRALDVAAWRSPRGLAFVWAQAALGSAKNLAQRIIGDSDLKRRLKARLRQATRPAAPLPPGSP